MEVTRELHLIEGRMSNIYLWLGNGGPFLVDAGFNACLRIGRLGPIAFNFRKNQDLEIIRNYLSFVGLEFTNLQAILVTHADLDHVGVVAAIQALSGAPVYAGAGTASLLQRGDSPKHMSWLVQFFIDRFICYQPLSSENIRVLSDGEPVLEQGEWYAVATPGHTPDHFSFFNPVKGVLLSGDALDMRTNRLRNTPQRIAADWPESLRSARRLLLLHPAIIACGHGKPLMGHDAGEAMMLYRQMGDELDQLLNTEQVGGAP
jgi:glyoxylase-like metal-dependent hydrolase (beta-lactamase superfamily II)